MSKLKVFDAKGQPSGEFEVADALLVLDKGDQAVHDAIVAYQAGLRAGTASTLRKGEVSGSNKKPWRQKGTGRARSGYTRSPVWKGGGVAFGPHPRDYAMGLPRRVARLAFRRALSSRIAAGAVHVLNELALEKPKTRELAGILKSMGVEGSVLLVTDKADRSVDMAARNMPGVESATARTVNTYQVLRHPVMVVTRAGMDGLKGRLEGGAGRTA